jgi:predicted TIM-barrel fold metal-dependent hydrolase
MLRRDLLTLGAGAISSAFISPNHLVGAATEPLDVIDCHTHFYDPTRPDGVPWPGKGSSIYRTVLPSHLRAVAQYRKVTGTVIVEASPRLEDNQWLLDIAKDDPFVVGIVGHVKPEDSEFQKNIKRFAANPLFRGIRVSSAVVRASLESNALKPFELLSELGLMLDINGGPENPPLVAQLATKIPSLQCVVNHMGNVAITKNTPPTDWSDGIRAAGQRPNVACKLSAFMGGASRNGAKAPEDVAFYQPYFDVVWNAFGEDRVIYGSDWPNSEPSGHYSVQQRLSFEYVSAKGANVLQKFASLNAKRAYRWIERPGRIK